MRSLSDSTRALLAGAIALAIIGGMLVGHAWPLWTGDDIVIDADVNGAPRWTRGEYVSLSTKADALLVAGTPAPNDHGQWTVVRAVEPWVTLDTGAKVRHMRGRTVYVQLDRDASGAFAPVSISLDPVDSALNLRGIVESAYNGLFRIEYGIDAFYMQEGHAATVERAFREKRRVQMQVAITKSGRARIRNLLVDGVPVS
ncbi:MAG TPA: GDYXXLXY domain-containing protein [Vicinamibacterales bacterium]